MQAWVLLVVAIVLEVAGTTAMKLSDGFSKFWPSVCLFLFYMASFTALTFSLKKLDVSVAYAIWSGLGTALIAALGVFYFQEAMTLHKAICLLLIILGVVGLNLQPGAAH